MATTVQIQLHDIQPRDVHLCDVVKVEHPVDLALVFCSGDHLTLDIFVIRDGEALAHGAGSHELGSVRVVQGVLQDNNTFQAFYTNIAWRCDC